MKYIVGVWVPNLQVEVEAKDEGEAYDIVREMIDNGDPRIDAAYEDLKGYEEIANCSIVNEAGFLEEICEW